MTTAAPSAPTAADLREIDEKQSRLVALMDQNDWSAILLRRHENLAWATAGRVEARVGLSSETAVCSLLVTHTGKRYYLAPENEGPRLAAEEFAGLDVEPILYPWIDDQTEDLAHKLAGVEIASDTAAPGSPTGFYPVNLTPLRTPLLPGEIARYRALGAEVAASTTRVLKTLAPGVTEDEMAARVAADLLARHIAPTVLLMAADERIFRYKHAVPRSGVLKHYGMLNLCARRHGLVISITRFIHFGPPPAALAANFDKVARINAELLHASREGVTAANLYAVAARAYAAVGAPDEIHKHHQGGTIGYTERDWLAVPSATETVSSAHGFAWNPSLQGAKIEDTALLHSDINQGGMIDILTPTPDLPVIETSIGGTLVRSAGIFLP